MAHNATDIPVKVNNGSLIELKNALDDATKVSLHNNPRTLYTIIAFPVSSGLNLYSWLSHKNTMKPMVDLRVLYSCS